MSQAKTVTMDRERSVQVTFNLRTRQVKALKQFLKCLFGGNREAFSKMMPPLRGRPPNREECARLDAFLSLERALKPRKTSTKAS